ncbi:LpxL/LpxP family Kdo(2)-lipid IV(A) lauroyl/palmitoleoyl acyltransferase [Endozoicomonas sp. 8E]|uniref:LpxL/LpxP family Kdo(2)-lipid IV(A) lauroyl/palmitoleoyl acyltransferase n=1 Tax=Endozoicomonas sp. 8E TaxID=3035692 RepID=UPI0029390B5A|nr:LpxL/LpxP family Kdo(2)-lipid IV(A) lauroyl/palmitoleoyl acyltransferase [Endozoicomonas sp. 8E]WOG25979.1 LpxL/LpxP family Kdo(2)-lipid IV(A) lauroyl/palmitoleoyl acyltransferase [Endozoicomonas sp. 8E]
MKSDELSNTTEADRFRWSYLKPKFWPVWLGLGFTALVALLPYSVMVRLGRLIGRLLLRFGGSRVRITRVNLAKCFPHLSEAERDALLQKNFESVGIGLMEVIMAWWWPRERLERLVTYKGLEHLSSETGQGNLLLILHFTTIEISGALITLRHSVDATYREHKNPVFEYMQRRQRLRYDRGSRLLGRRDVRGMLRSLRQGKTVWYSPDQDYGPKQSVFAPFFGVQTASVTGTSRMTRMGKARVVPMVVTRKPGSEGYVLEVFEAWKDFPKGDDLQDAIRVNQFVEEQVKKKPDQYMWLHRRFKTRPEGEVGFYRKS